MVVSMRFYSSVLSRILRSTSTLTLMILSSFPVSAMDDGSDLVRKAALHRMSQGGTTDEASSALHQLQTAPFGEEIKERFFTPKGTDDFDLRIYKTVDIGYSDRSRTDQYGLGIPTAPVFHPYHMDENKTEYGSPAFTLNIKLPQYFPDFVPPALHRHLAGINEQEIDTFIIVQDMPWENTKLLFRPQYYLDPHAPVEDSGVYSKSFLTQVGLFSRNPSGPILLKLKRPGQPEDQIQPENELITEHLSVHNSKALISNELFTRYKNGGIITAAEQPRLNNLILLDRARNGEVLSGEEARKVKDLGWNAEFPNIFGNPMNISSGNTPVVVGLDLHESNVLFSLTKCGDRTAVVKHILLNPEDEAVFEEVLFNSRNLLELQENLEKPENSSKLSPSGKGIPEEFDLFKVLKSSSKL